MGVGEAVEEAMTSAVQGLFGLERFCALKRAENIRELVW